MKTVFPPSDSSVTGQVDSFRRERAKRRERETFGYGGPRYVTLDDALCGRRWYTVVTKAKDHGSLRLRRVSISEGAKKCLTDL